MSISIYFRKAYGIQYSMRKLSNSTILSMLGSLMLAVFLSILAIMLSVKLGFATNGSVIKSMNEVNYYQIVYEDLMDKSESLTIPCGLGTEVLDGVFSVKQMKSDGNKYLKAELNSTTFKFDTEIYRKKLSDNIYAYIEANNLTADGDVDEVVGHLVDDIMDYYIDTIRVPYAATIGVIFRNISHYFKYVFAFMLLLSVGVIVLIVMQHPHKKNRIFRYLAYSTMSGAISVLVIPIFCMVTGFYKRLQIYPEYMYRFMVRYIENGINVFLIIGIILLLTSFIMIGLSSYIKYRYKHMHHSHHREETEND